MVQATKVGSTEVHAVEAGSDEVGPPYIWMFFSLQTWNDVFGEGDEGNKKRG